MGILGTGPLSLEVGSLELRVEPHCRPFRNITSQRVLMGCLALNRYAEMALFHPYGAAESREHVSFLDFTVPSRPEYLAVKGKVELFANPFS